jgi:hypothetical protein
MENWNPTMAENPTLIPRLLAISSSSDHPRSTFAPQPPFSSNASRPQLPPAWHPKMELPPNDAPMEAPWEIVISFVPK